MSYQLVFPGKTTLTVQISIHLCIPFIHFCAGCPQSLTAGPYFLFVFQYHTHIMLKLIHAAFLLCFKMNHWPNTRIISNFVFEVSFHLTATAWLNLSINTNTADFPNSWTEEEVQMPPCPVHFSVLKTLRLVADYNANFLLDKGRTEREG
jgi:hypothetical protein